MFTSSSFVFVLFLTGFWFYYLFLNNIYSNQSYDYLYLIDEVSLFIVFITVFVLFISYIYSFSFKSNYKLNLVFLSMLIFCFGVFTTQNMFLLYFFYECSLLPILYIIIKWGSYPERSLRAIILLIYTSIFTFPFIAVIFTFYSLNGSFSLTIPFMSLITPIRLLASLVIFCTFAVKLPIYGLHFWLPIAHVEAPTFGSIILAGVLLKLGGVGLLRSIALLDLAGLSKLTLAYFIVFLVYVTIVCLFQSDFKRLVAYSSVSHIIAIPLLLLSNNLISTKRIIILILFHGLRSPILFMLVGVVYSMFSTRQLILIRGLILTSPLIRFMLILAFFFTLSAPPFPSFVSEVYFLMSSIVLSSYLVYFFFIFTFLSLAYNLNWLRAMVFSRSSPSIVTTTVSYIRFIPICTSFILCVPIIFLMYLMWRWLYFLN